MPEVSFGLSSLCESCNNQITNAIDAYAQAIGLDHSNPTITQGLQLLSAEGRGRRELSSAYASAVVPPPGLDEPLSQGGHRGAIRADSRGPGDITLPPAHVGNSHVPSPPFLRGGSPPPVNIDEPLHLVASTYMARSVTHAYHPARDGPGHGHPLPRQGDDIRPPMHGPLLWQVLSRSAPLKFTRTI
jgi:hypothetical protein